MPALAEAARLVLATALLGAAVTKVRTRERLLVVAAEVAVAVALLVWPWRAAPAVAAFVLLAAFTALLGRDLVRGSREPCRCFGELTNRPLSTRALLRNGWLLALAVLAAGTRSGPSVAAVLALTAALGVVTAAAVALG